MVKHIVLFKLKEEAPAEKKLEAMHAFKQAIEALPESRRDVEHRPVQ